MSHPTFICCEEALVEIIKSSTLFKWEKNSLKRTYQAPYWIDNCRLNWVIFHVHTFFKKIFNSGRLLECQTFWIPFRSADLGPNGLQWQNSLLARKELILFISLCDGISQLIWTNPALYRLLKMYHNLWVMTFGSFYFKRMMHNVYKNEPVGLGHLFVSIYYSKWLCSPYSSDTIWDCLWNICYRWKMLITYMLWLKGLNPDSRVRNQTLCIPVLMNIASPCRRISALVSMNLITSHS